MPMGVPSFPLPNPPALQSRQGSVPNSRGLIKGLTRDPSEWAVHGTPLTAMIGIERRKGKEKPVIHKVRP